MFRDRLLVGADGAGLRTMQMPASFVRETSVAHDAFIARGEPFVVTFNEAIAVDSMMENGVVEVRRIDTNELIDTSVIALDVTDTSARRYHIEFDRDAGVTYKINIDGANNLRGTEQWAPFTQRLTQAPDLARRAKITDISNNLYAQGSQEPIVFVGEGFGPNVRVFVDEYPIDTVLVTENRVEIPASTLDILPLGIGQHHVKFVDGGLETLLPGAIVISERFNNPEFTLTPDSSQINGGSKATIKASQQIILPGTKVILRSDSGREIRSQVNDLGFDFINLRDDVETLSRFTFDIPAVIIPERYNVYLLINGVEVLAGHISYTLGEGLGFSLPNYPPQELGAAEVRNDILFAGVKRGAPANKGNRFLMESGLEIYDIGIWENPIRLSQLHSDQPVLGIATVDNVAFLANAENGLSIVNVTDLANPLLIRNFAVPNHIATDVAYKANDRMLALSVADQLGTGFIRFHDLNDDFLAPPVGLSTISFSKGDLLGQPLDIQWLDEQLYVLLKRDNQLYLVIFNDPSDPSSYKVQAIERGLVGNLMDASMRVQ
jgi:hypothetical protein